MCHFHLIFEESRNSSQLSFFEVLIQIVDITCILVTEVFGTGVLPVMAVSDSLKDLYFPQKTAPARISKCS